MEWSDEQKLVLDGKGNMLVSASAGSGKTTVMVEKVLRLIKSGVDLRRILLMTFTRAAAKEMREKLVKKMYEEVRGENGEYIRAQIANLPFASIETIDGFCFSLMRKYFNVAGCDPAAATGEENAMKRALDESVDKAMEILFGRNDGEFIEAADFFRKRRSYDPFKQTVLKIIGFASARPDRDKFYELCASTDEQAVEKYYLEHRKLSVKYLITEIEAFREECAAEGYNDGTEPYNDAYERLKSVYGTESVSEFISTVSGIDVPKKINARLVKKGTVSGELAERSALVNDRIKTLMKKVAEDGEAHARRRENGQQQLIKRKLAETCILAEKEYASYKKRRNVVDLRDATDSALKILSDEKAREEIRSRFDYVFVDEYQDTNYLQEALIDGIGNGNVFSVGDVKQAIYHFRAAEPEIFIRRGERYDSGEEGKNYYLNTNYRSCGDILGFTNRVCDKVMVKDFCGIDYKNTARLSYGGKIKPIKGVAPVRVFVNGKKEIPPEIPRGKIYSVREAVTEESVDRESEFIASEILSITKNTFIEEGGTSRRPEYGDIAILVRVGSKFKPVTDALERKGIPYYTLKENIGIFPEREALIDVLRTVLNAENDIALYNAAVSPAGGFTDDELTAIRTDTTYGKTENTLWGTLNEYKGSLELEKKAKSFINFIENLRNKSAYYTAEEALREILSRNFDSHLRGRNAKVLAELNAFISYAGNVAANASCEEFIEYYDTCYKGNKPPVAKNAVAVMTMHGSKGLEFPIVFLPYQDGKGKNTVGNTELDGDLGLAVRLFSEEEKTVEDTFEARVIRMKCRDEERRELARLMYVAFTRAKNCLIISGKKVNPPLNVFDGASVMQWITFAAESDGKLAEAVTELPDIPEEKAQIKPKEQKDFDWERLKKKYKYEAETVMPVKYSVSEILSKQEGYGFNPFGKTGRAATEGTAVHAVMQYIDFGTDTLDGVKRALKEMVGAGILSEEEAESVDCGKILTALGSDIIAEARRYTYKREEPFVMYVSLDGKSGKVLVQGVIDLLIDEGDGYVVVDFKTGEADEKRLAERYGKQLSLYAEGVEKILKKPVKRKVIYSTGLGKSIEV